MIPVGYIAKQVVQHPELLEAPGIEDVYSVSGCISHNFLDYVPLWRHNGYWLFDRPEIIKQVAQENGVDLENMQFFYFEAYEYEFDEKTMKWKAFKPEDFPTDIVPPATKKFHGYDVVCFSMGTTPECSPLSCNLLANEIKTNVHCLLETLEETRGLLESEKFVHCEPGPFRIFAVYTIDPDHWFEA